MQCTIRQRRHLEYNSLRHAEPTQSQQSVYTFQPAEQPARRNVLSIHVINKQIRVEFVEFCNRASFCHLSGSYATEGKNNKLIKTIFKNFDQTRHIVYCPHSRLAGRQPNDVVSVLAGPLKRRLAALICIVLHPTGCTAGCGHTAGCDV